LQIFREGKISGKLSRSESDPGNDRSCGSVTIAFQILNGIQQSECNFCFVPLK
jgi:hypothetical protein